MDHFDRNPNNNHINNLRPSTGQSDATWKQQIEHSPLAKGGFRRRNNKTGETGVGQFCERAHGYPTYLTFEGQKVHSKLLNEKHGYTNDAAGLKKAIQYMKGIRAQFLGIEDSDGEGSEVSDGGGGGG